MEAQTAQEAPGRRCEACETTNLATARYCKQCGASFAPPPACPACQTELNKDARFCPSCGVKVVGMRPVREAAAPAAPVSLPVPSVAKADVADAPDAQSAEIKALTDNLPKAAPSGRSSKLLTNVLMFVALLSVFVVVMYQVNKDAKKEISPFEGGPPPMKTTTQQPAQQQQQATGGAGSAGTPSGGAPFSGTIKVAPDLSASAPAGTIFIIVRMAGMPDRGPPVAVKKYEQPSYPLSFELGPGDVMQQGMPFEGPFDVYVRLDADGNAMTKAPGDLSASAPKAGVKAGDKDVELTLDKRL